MRRLCLNIYYDDFGCEVSILAVNDRKCVFHFRPKPNIWPEKHLALGRIPKPKPNVQIYVKIGGFICFKRLLIKWFHSTNIICTYGHFDHYHSYALSGRLLNQMISYYKYHMYGHFDHKHSYVLRDFQKMISNITNITSIVILIMNIHVLQKTCDPTVIQFYL